MDEVEPDRQLKGKTNFISWKREFERAARANDALEFLTGEEVVPLKPNKDEYFVKVLDTETRRSTRIKKSLSPTTDDENETDDGQAVVLTTNNTLRWQIDHNEHKNAKEKMKLASRLLDAWISGGIKIEIEDCADAKEAYDFIKKRYAVTNERARDILLNRLHDLKLDQCESVTEYTNQVRQIKADLKTVKYDMTDDMFATALLHGLPPSYRSFKEKYGWVRSIKPDDSPDLDYLFERMHVEEMHQLQMKEERKARDKARRDASNGNTMNWTILPVTGRDGRTEITSIAPILAVARLAIAKIIAGLRTPRKFHGLSKKSSPTPPTGPLSIMAWVVSQK
jgi:hypothetical protein